MLHATSWQDVVYIDDKEDLHGDSISLANRETLIGVQ